MSEAHAHKHPAEQSHHVDHDDHAHPNYVKVYWILLALLVVSMIGPEFGIQPVTLITAFGVALIKAYLVVKNFMHLNIEKRYVVYMVTTCLVFMLLFFAGVAPDVMKQEGSGWIKPAVEVPTADARNAERAAAAGMEPGAGSQH
jgi:caa(3)-type oxidase subunit IV